MQSEVNLSIVIDHEENLPLNAQQITGEVAKAIAPVLGLSEGRLYVMDDNRHASCGPVMVTLRSAFIVRDNEKTTSYSITPL